MKQRLCGWTLEVDPVQQPTTVPMLLEVSNGFNLTRMEAVNEQLAAPAWHGDIKCPWPLEECH